MANWIIIGLLLRISDNARRPQEEFATGVLPTYAHDDDDASSRTASTASGSSRSAIPASASGSSSTDDAPTEVRPAVRTDEGGPA